MTLAALPNYLQYLLHRPGASWDPVGEAYASKYATKVWGESEITQRYINRVIEHVGSVDGARVLDLGGGPGQYSIGFAERGARVTWHDISASYEAIVRTKAKERGVSVETSVGYLEDSRKFLSSPFDLVFVRGCWHYCMNDKAFASLVYQLALPGKWIAVWGNNSSILNKKDASFSLRSRLSHTINDRVGIKIGHPYPPQGRLANLFTELGAHKVVADYGDVWFDDLFIKRAPLS